MTLRRLIVLIAGLIGLSAPIAAAAIPGPQRALAPSAYGMSEIAPGIFTDDPSHAETQIRMVAEANDRVRAFFGELRAAPRYVMCTTLMCERTFGGSGNVAVAYGWSLIRIPPKAFQQPDLGVVLLAHERVHSELVRRWGASALWEGKIPNWFNEGLASFVSRDHRLPETYDAGTLAWIRGSKTFWDWGRFVDERGWRDAYGAAAANVALIHAESGNRGLQSLISRALGGENFDAAMRDIAGF